MGDTPYAKGRTTLANFAKKVNAFGGGYTSNPYFSLR
jgi:hypothetical protein